MNIVREKTFRLLSCFYFCLLLCICFASSNSLAAAKYWIGSGSFSDDANWSTTSGGAGDTTVPTASDDAIFDDGGTGDCSIDTAISVKGLKLESGYSGTLTQGAGATIAVGANGYVQEDGTFVGGDADMSVYSFLLSDGSFTAPRETITLLTGTILPVTGLDIFIKTGGSFYHNNGTLKFKSWLNSTGNEDVRIKLNEGELETYNLIFTGGNVATKHLRYWLGEGEKFIVYGDLLIEADTLANPNATVYLNNGSIELNGGLTVKSGLRGGTAALYLIGSDDQAYNYFGGTMLNTVIVDKASGSLVPGSDPMDFRVQRLELRDGEFVAPNGLFNAASHYEQSGGVFLGSHSEVSLYSFSLSGGTFIAPEGTMTIANTLADTIFKKTGGTFEHSSGTLKFRSWLNTTGADSLWIDLNGDALEVHRLIFSGGNYGGKHGNYKLGSDDRFIVADDLLIEADTMAHDNATVYVNYGYIDLKGDLTVNSGVLGGSVGLTFVGTNEQSCAHNGGALPFSSLTIDKTGGKLLLCFRRKWTMATNRIG